MNKNNSKASVPVTVGVGGSVPVTVGGGGSVPVTVGVNNKLHYIDTI